MAVQYGKYVTKNIIVLKNESLLEKALIKNMCIIFIILFKDKIKIKIKTSDLYLEGNDMKLSYL